MGRGDVCLLTDGGAGLKRGEDRPRLIKLTTPFFMIELQTRRVTIARIHPQLGGAWMEQRARNLTDPVDGFLRTARHLIHDRDPLCTRVFGEILTSGDVQPI